MRWNKERKHFLVCFGVVLCENSTQLRNQQVVFGEIFGLQEVVATAFAWAEEVRCYVESPPTRLGSLNSPSGCIISNRRVRSLFLGALGKESGRLHHETHFLSHRPNLFALHYLEIALYTTPTYPWGISLLWLLYVDANPATFGSSYPYRNFTVICMVQVYKYIFLGWVAMLRKLKPSRFPARYCGRVLWQVQFGPNCK